MDNLNWSELGFGYVKTDYNVRCYYRNGKWGELEVSSSEILNIHMAATCLHYGQESFEGQKVFRGKDGKSFGRGRTAGIEARDEDHRWMSGRAPGNRNRGVSKWPRIATET